jgi:multiple sugar transport system ATP-binding protein
LEGVEKSFAGATAVARLDLEVRDREFLTLLGPSGCGKSTVLNLVAGLLSPSRGEIYIGERKVTDLPPQERDVAMVFQSYALYPHKSVFENIAFPLRLRGVPRASIETRVREVAGRLGLATLLDRRPAELSGGQRQRVALGRALVRQPHVFLLDEPLSNLDAQLRTETRAELKRLHREFVTTAIYVTHDQMEAMTLSERIAVLKDGKLQQLGTPEEIYQTPANRFVASFVGNPGMNFVNGRIEGTRLVLPGCEKELSSEFASVSERSRLGEVSVGIRPEHVELSSGSGPEAEIYAVEPLGAEVLVVLSFLGTRIVARTAPGFRGGPGDLVHFDIQPGKALLFEPSTGERLPLGPV